MLMGKNVCGGAKRKAVSDEIDQHWFWQYGVGNRLVAIVSPESAPIKRIIQDARDRGTLIDATYGRRTRAVIVTDSDHVILSAVQPETVANRVNDHDEDDDEEIEDHE